MGLSVKSNQNAVLKLGPQLLQLSANICWLTSKNDKNSGHFKRKIPDDTNLMPSDSLKKPEFIHHFFVTDYQPFIF